MPDDQQVPENQRPAKKRLAAAGLVGGALAIGVAAALVFAGAGHAPHKKTLISETSSIRVEVQVAAALDFHDTSSDDLELVGGCSEALY